MISKNCQKSIKITNIFINILENKNGNISQKSNKINIKESNKKHPNEIINSTPYNISNNNNNLSLIIYHIIYNKIKEDN